MPAQYLMGHVNEAMVNLLMVTQLRNLLIRTCHYSPAANGVPSNISKYDSVLAQYTTDNVKLMSARGVSNRGKSPTRFYVLVLWVRWYYGSCSLKHIQWEKSCKFWKKKRLLLQIILGNNVKLTKKIKLGDDI